MEDSVVDDTVQRIVWEPKRSDQKKRLSRAGIERTNPGTELIEEREGSGIERCAGSRWMDISQTMQSRNHPNPAEEYPRV